MKSLSKNVYFIMTYIIVLFTQSFILGKLSFLLYESRLVLDIALLAITLVIEPVIVIFALNIVKKIFNVTSVTAGFIAILLSYAGFPNVILSGYGYNTLFGLSTSFLDNIYYHFWVNHMFMILSVIALSIAHIIYLLVASKKATS